MSFYKSKLYSLSAFFKAKARFPDSKTESNSKVFSDSSADKFL
jgi:hypothetical protein